MTYKKVYDLGQWLECNGNIGRVIAKSMTLLGFECLPGIEADPDINTSANNGRGYCVAWGEVATFASGDEFSVRRHRWIREDTIQDPRYKAIECPLSQREEPTKEEPEQLQITMNVDSATKAFLREQVAAGEKAKDILRAMGEAA